MIALAWSISAAHAIPNYCHDEVQSDECCMFAISSIFHGDYYDCVVSFDGGEVFETVRTLDYDECVAFVKGGCPLSLHEDDHEDLEYLDDLKFESAPSKTKGPYATLDLDPVCMPVT